MTHIIKLCNELEALGRIDGSIAGKDCSETRINFSNDTTSVTLNQRSFVGMLPKDDKFKKYEESQSKKERYTLQ